jgi:tetratricopeptide (TPR) repeat protein
MRLSVFIALVCFALFSCKNNKEITKNSGVINKSAPSVYGEKFTTLFIKATNLAMIEDYDKAIELYEKCKAINAKNPAVYYELSRLYAQKRNAQLASDNAEKALELSPKNKWYLLQKAIVLNRTGQSDKAMEAYEDLLKVDTKNLPVLYELVELYQRESNYKQAANTITKIENITGKNSRMSYQKYLLLMDAGEQEAALDEIIALLKLDPSNGMGNLAMAQHYKKNSEENKIYQCLVFVFEDAEIRTDTKLSVLMDYIKKVKTDEKARVEALSLIGIMQKNHPKDVKSYAVAGDYYANIGDMKQANENYEKALEFSTQTFPLYMQLMENSYNAMDYAKVVSYAEQAIESYPTQPVLFLYKGMGHKEQKEYTKAISAFKTGKNVVVDDEKISFDFYSKLGETYHLMKDYKQSDEAFEKALEINGLEPFMLNNYSYYLSLRNEKLDKAANMSKKTNDLYPTNASFNDTYGWILFQQGKIEEAERWIKKSLENGGNKSGTVLEHYGDVLKKLDGNSTRALEYWERAKLTGEYSDELETKITEAKQ